MPATIRPMQPDDWPDVRAIYEQGIAPGDATFETEVPDWKMWDASHWAAPRIVAVVEEIVIGWAALTPISRRATYHGVAELSVYVRESERGLGVGRLLLDELVRRSEKEGFWMLQAAIFPENVASLRLHHACGFREVGRRERIARSGQGVWRDTILVERRSQTVGA